MEEGRDIDSIHFELDDQLSYLMLRQDEFFGRETEDVDFPLYVWWEDLMERLNDTILELEDEISELEQEIFELKQGSCA